MPNPKLIELLKQLLKIQLVRGRLYVTGASRKKELFFQRRYKILLRVIATKMAELEVGNSQYNVKFPRSKSNINKEILELMYQCCDIFGISVDLLKTRCRKAEIVAARQYYFYMLNQKYEKKMSFQAMGNTINRDHATVMYSIKEMEHRLKHDAWVRNMVAIHNNTN